MKTRCMEDIHLTSMGLSTLKECFHFPSYVTLRLLSMSLCAMIFDHGFQICTLVTLLCYSNLYISDFFFACDQGWLTHWYNFAGVLFPSLAQGSSLQVLLSVHMLYKMRISNNIWQVLNDNMNCFVVQHCKLIHFVAI